VGLGHRERVEQVVIEGRGLTKSFGGIRALDSVDITVREGQLTGVIGPNGAGKTTLLNCLTGFYNPTSGSVVVEGMDVTRWQANRQVSKYGMVRSFQNVRLLSELDAVENVVLGAYRRRSYGLIRAILGRRKRFHQREADLAQNLLMELGLDREAWYRPVTGLSYGQRRLVELARMSAADPRYLLLDEPTAGMNEIGSKKLAGWLRGQVEMGIGVLLVSHDMPLVMENCDEVVVLNLGELLTRGTPEQIRDNPEVVSAYLGTNEGETLDGP
jgi:ABC-type branched-subunit amino acid transport system ATPase component